MTLHTDTLPEKLKQDLLRNREGKLSSRQWLELVTEPVVSLMLLMVPLILLIGRAGIAGRYIVLIVVVGFLLMAGFRAVRFSRVKLMYRTLYAEQSYPRWMFWRKTTLTSVGGDPVRFDYQVVHKRDFPNDQALQVYYMDVADRRILLSVIPEKHPQATFAQPTDLFKRRGGKIISG